MGVAGDLGEERVWKSAGLAHDVMGLGWLFRRSYWEVIAILTELPFTYCGLWIRVGKRKEGGTGMSPLLMARAGWWGWWGLRRWFYG